MSTPSSGDPVQNSTTSSAPVTEVPQQIDTSKGGPMEYVAKKERKARAKKADVTVTLAPTTTAAQEETKAIPTPAAAEQQQQQQEEQKTPTPTPTPVLQAQPETTATPQQQRQSNVHPVIERTRMLIQAMRDRKAKLILDKAQHTSSSQPKQNTTTGSGKGNAPPLRQQQQQPPSAATTAISQQSKEIAKAPQIMKGNAPLRHQQQGVDNRLAGTRLFRRFLH